MKILIKEIPCLMYIKGRYTVEKHSVYIDKGIIAALDKKPDGFVPERTIAEKNGLLIPGMINAHTHVAMSVFRNSADDKAFDDWLFGCILPREDHMTDEDAYWGATLSFAEMLRTGTTCFYDMYMFINTIIDAAEASGMRGVVARSISSKGVNDAHGLNSLREAMESIERVRGIDRISAALSPHSPETCSRDFYEYIAAIAREKALPVATHLSESVNEFETIKKEYNMTPTELLASTGILDAKTLAAHCVQMTDNDISILKEKKVCVATNPISNMKLANGFAPISRFLEAGVSVSLGTDGAASNNSQNMFKEAAVLALIHKGNEKNSLTLSAQQTLECIYRGGADAVGMKDIGQIKEGFKADLAVLDLDTPNMVPEKDIVSSLIYSASGYETKTVIVGGDVLYDNGEYKTIDIEKAYYYARLSSKRL